MDKKRDEVVSRILAKINGDPELKARINASVDLDTSVIDVFDLYLKDQQSYNQGHLEEFGEFCIRKTLQKKRYIPASLLLIDWMHR